MRQTLALLLDAYRELNARKLFWITVGISGLIVAVYAAAGIDEKGLTFLHWHIPAPITSKLIPPSLFYKFVFAKLGIPWWLTWGAMILALISTASIIPEFVLGGAVELTLSKPIGRVRLFLTKYFCGLLFVGLQVSVFATACFLVIGLRGGAWQPTVFLAVPIVLAVFSYIYSVSALVGMLTRSTIASVLVAILFWFILFILNSADTITLGMRKESERGVKQLQAQVDRAETATRKKLIEMRTEEAKAAGKEGEPIAEPTTVDLDNANAILATRRMRLVDTQAALKTRTWWSNLFLYIKAPLPKTTETTGLLDRYLITQDDLGLLRKFDERPGEFDEEEVDDLGNPVKSELTPEQRRAARHNSNDRVQSDIEDVFRSRSLWWVIGTSLGFEAAVLGLACLIFARKDF